MADKHPKSTADIVKKLLSYQEIGNLPVIALVISCGTETELMFSNEGNEDFLVLRLNAIVADGGNPVGFIGVTGDGKVKTYPLSNYKDSPRVEAYLEAVQRASLSMLLQMSSVADVRAC